MVPLSSNKTSISGPTTDRSYINLTDSSSEDVLKALKEQGGHFVVSDFQGMKYAAADQSLRSIFTRIMDPKECSNLTVRRLSDHERRKSNSNNSVESATSEPNTFQYEVEDGGAAQLTWEEPLMHFHPLDGPSRARRQPSLDSMRVYTGED
jgi:hypothetical protein